MVAAKHGAGKTDDRCGCSCIVCTLDTNFACRWYDDRPGRISRLIQCWHHKFWRRTMMTPLKMILIRPESPLEIAQESLSLQLSIRNAQACKETQGLGL